jgi:tRNA-dihydrouridine synthase
MNGAYLLEQSNILLHLIEQMTYYIAIPITIKLRLLPSHRNYQLENYQHMLNKLL